MRISGVEPQAARDGGTARRATFAVALAIGCAGLVSACGSATASKTPTIVIPSATPSATELASADPATQPTQASTPSATPTEQVGGEVPVDPNALESADGGATGTQADQASLPVPSQTELLRSETAGAVTKSYYNSQLTPQQVVQEYVAALGGNGWSVTSTSEGGWGPGGTGLSATKDRRFLFIVSGTEGNPTFVNACIAESRAAAREACT